MRWADFEFTGYLFHDSVRVPGHLSGDSEVSMVLWSMVASAMVMTMERREI